MLSNFLIIIFLLIGMGFIYKKYFNNENENENENENTTVNTNTNVKVENYKPFSINQHKGTIVDTHDISVKTPYTREKTTTGLLNII